MIFRHSCNSCVQTCILHVKCCLSSIMKIDQIEVLQCMSLCFRWILCFVVRDKSGKEQFLNVRQYLGKTLEIQLDQSFFLEFYNFLKEKNYLFIMIILHTNPSSYPISSICPAVCPIHTTVITFREMSWDLSSVKLQQFQRFHSTCRALRKLD